MAGVYQEDEDSTFESDGRLYRLNPLFVIAQRLPVRQMALSELRWMEPYLKIDPKRLELADCKVPLLIHRDSRSKRWVVIDGAHRLQKAINSGLKTIAVKVLSQAQLESARVDQGTSPKYKNW